MGLTSVCVERTEGHENCMLQYIPSAGNELRDRKIKYQKRKCALSYLISARDPYQQTHWCSACLHSQQHFPLLDRRKFKSNTSESKWRFKNSSLWVTSAQAKCRPLQTRVEDFFLNLFELRWHVTMLSSQHGNNFLSTSLLLPNLASAFAAGVNLARLH